MPGLLTRTCKKKTAIKQTNPKKMSMHLLSVISIPVVNELFDIKPFCSFFYLRNPRTRVFKGDLLKTINEGSDIPVRGSGTGLQVSLSVLCRPVRAGVGAGAGR